MASPTIDVKNRRAGFEYHLLDTFECGMVLTGSEIKSIRAGGASLNEAFCAFVGSELVVRAMQINPYGSNPNYRTRTETGPQATAAPTRVGQVEEEAEGLRYHDHSYAPVHCQERLCQIGDRPRQRQEAIR